ncbi:MAG: hypothetical protein H7235_01635 [Bdellovibrionaceae bacterium]|nr:hypothetical protein [Pseudobdellovibrionaceae bacterium]
MSNNLKKELLKAKQNKQTTQLVAIRLPKDLHDKILKLSKETGQSKSQVIVYALKEVFS